MQSPDFLLVGGCLRRARLKSNCGDQQDLAAIAIWCYQGRRRGYHSGVMQSIGTESDQHSVFQVTLTSFKKSKQRLIQQSCRCTSLWTLRRGSGRAAQQSDAPLGRGSDWREPTPL